MSSDVLANFEDLDYPGQRKPVNRDKKDVVPGPRSGTPNRCITGSPASRRGVLPDLPRGQGTGLQRAVDPCLGGPGSARSHPLPITTYGPPVAGGRSNKGKRLWTREQVLGIIRIAKKHRVIFPNRRGIKHPPTPAFAAEVGEFFASLTQ